MIILTFLLELYKSNNIYPLPKKKVHLEPVNVILFGNRIFANIIKDFLYKIIPSKGGALNPMTLILRQDRHTLVRKPSVNKGRLE